MDDEARDTLQLFRLDGKVAVITGAGKGIGAATAVAFADAGADVALLARTESDLVSVAGRVEERGRRAMVLPGDANDLDRFPALLEEIVGTLGHLDIVVNNAGGSTSYPFLDTRVEHLEHSFHFNVSAPFELSRLAVPYLLGREGANIINISSMAGHNNPRGQLVHGTTKAALSHMTRMMAADLNPRIRVNAILPGAVETESLRVYLDRMAPDIRRTMVEHTAMRRNGTPVDIAAAALYLASPAAAWVTGKLMQVDGSAQPELIPKGIDDL